MAAPKGNLYAKGNKGGDGRPPKYSPAMHDDLVYLLAKGGASRAELCEGLKITETTFDNWRHQHKTFLGALERARDYANGKVERSLYHRALGYSHDDTHISNWQGEITVTPIKKHYPPETAAAKFWLMNRKPKEWKERTEVNSNSTLTLEAGDSITGLLARIRGARNVTPPPAQELQADNG